MMMKFPRSLAIQVLVRVLSEHEPLDEVLSVAAKELPQNGLPWLQEICSGTLRWKGRLDWILDSLAVKKKPSGWLRKILLLAAYQLVVQDRAPAAAVVSETVSEVKAKEGQAPADFANACLRKVADHALKWRHLPFPAGSVEKQASWASLPEWLWVKLVNQQGLEWAQAYALASLERPILWIRKPLGAENLGGSEILPGPVEGSWYATSGGLVTDRPGFHEGDFIVQDISSQHLISEITSHIRKAISKNSLSVLDLCAAPGGKSVGLAWSGFQVTATDRVTSRLPRLRETVARVASAKIEVVSWDQLEDDWDKDLIWIDAPCSGTGILRRHPDVRWLRKEKELPCLIQTQRELLRMAWEKLLPGNYLAYSVCSVLQEEGPEAIHSLGLGTFMVENWFLSPQSSLQGDGFWAALLRK